MALPKLYDLITWHNNTTPALNEDNLNAMSKGLDDVDNRLIALAGTIMEDVPQIIEDMEILGPAIENIDANVTRAETAADDAEAEALKSEGYAIGTQDGVEVTSGEYYQKNAKYYAEIANPPIENTVDFTDIITITDAINKAAKDVRLKVEAVQDLHGYNNPWVGGAGKNKLPFSMSAIKANNPSDASKTWDGNKYTYSGVEFTPVLDSNGNLLYINVNTTESTHAAAYFFIYGSNAQSQPNIFKGMKLSGCPSGGSSSTYSIVWQSYETQIVYPQHLSGSDVGAGTTISEDAYTRMYISISANAVLDNVRFYPMIRLATVSDATYEPYENICPISGWDNAKVTRSGKNLYVGSPSFDGYAQSSNWVKQDETYNGHPVYKKTTAWDGAYQLVYLDEGTYTFSVAVKTSDSGKVAFFVGKTNVSTATTTPTYEQDIPTSTSWEKKSFTFTVTQAGTIALRVEKQSAGDIYVSEYQLEVGSTATEYESYKETVETTISLNGTRYGGTLDVTSGVLTLTHGYVLLKNAPNGWAEAHVDNLKRFRTAIGVPLEPIRTMATLISDSYETISDGRAFADCPPYCIYNDGLEAGIYIQDQRYSTAQELVAGMGDAQIVYPLATPQTIQLTAAEVYLLYGYNTLFGNCGDISLTYDASGIIHIEEAKLDTETLKTIAAASSDFADFKARIAAL